MGSLVLAILMGLCDDASLLDILRDGEAACQTSALLATDGGVPDAGPTAPTPPPTYPGRPRTLPGEIAK